LDKITHVLQTNLHMFDPLSLQKVWERLCKQRSRNRLLPQLCTS